MGGGTTSTTSTSGSANPTVTATLDKLLGPGGGVQGIFDAGPHVFNQSLFQPAGTTTQNAWDAALGAANNPAYGTGVSSGLTANNTLLANGGLTDTQRGNLTDIGNLADTYGRMAIDPASTQAGQNLIESVTRNTNSAFNNSGLFGSDNNQTALARGLTQGLGDLQQGYLSGQGSTLANAFGMGQQGVANQAGAIGNLSTLFSAGQAPSATAGAIGSAQDANAQGILTGNADLYSRQNNAKLNLLQQLMGTFTGAAPVGGTTTTQTQPATPWWQSAIGLGLGLL